VALDPNVGRCLYRDFGVALGHAALNVNGAAHSVDDANELHQHPPVKRL
jgi:hypothetical protein